MIYLNGNKIEFTNFPNGERCVDLKLTEHLDLRNEIIWKYEGDSSIVDLMFFMEAIKGVEALNELVIAYMPYSRMDRQGGNYLFTLKYVSLIINNMNFHKVKILEPHSDVCLALVDRSEGIDLTLQLFSNLLRKERLDNFVVMFPDSTAQKRYSKLYDCEQVYGIKQRDFKTGEITSLNVIGNVEGKNVVIIDDLSSFGGTFIQSANKLKEIGAKDIYLIVGHAEENIYKGKVFEKGSPIKKVYTTNSILNNRLFDNIEIANIFEEGFYGLLFGR